jgi:hypothetical integral membrane protein (TIGR02206 family)
MLKYFFTYEDRIPAGEGFSMFGWQHFLWLFLLAAAGRLFYLNYRKQDPERKKRMTLLIAEGLVSLELIRILMLIVTGAFSVYELPLHLCSMSGFICLYDALRKNTWSGQTLYSLCLPGTVSALVFPDWTVYPPVHFITIQGFLFHAGIVLYVLCRMESGDIRPDIRKIGKPFLFLLVTVPPIYVFDRIFQANYFFVNVPSPDSPLSVMAGFLGVPGYLFGYAVLVALVVSAMYLFYRPFEKKAGMRAST